MLGGLIALFILGLPIVAVILIIGAIVRYSKSEGREEDFEEIVRSLYVYFILICSIFAMLISAVGLFNAVLEFIIPDTGEYVNQNEKTVQMLSFVSLFVVSFLIFLFHNDMAKRDLNEKKELKKVTKASKGK